MKFVLPSVRRQSFRRLCLTDCGDLIAQHILRLPVDFRGPTCSELAALMLGLPRAERLDPAWITDYCEMRRANHDR